MQRITKYQLLLKVRHGAALPGSASTGAPPAAWPRCGHPHCYHPLLVTHRPGSLPWLSRSASVSEPPSAHLRKGLAPHRLLWGNCCAPTIVGAGAGTEQCTYGQTLPHGHMLRGSPHPHWAVLPHRSSWQGLPCVPYLCGPSRGSSTGWSEPVNGCEEGTCKSQMSIRGVRFETKE